MRARQAAEEDEKDADETGHESVMVRAEEWKDKERRCHARRDGEDANI